MNIRPQEVTQNGERSVQYKGSDGKLHSMLPQDAAIPVVQRTAIEAGTEISLGQAHELAGFDFNKVSALRFNEGFSEFANFYVNFNGEDQQHLMYEYHGKPWMKYKKDGEQYVLFNNLETPDCTSEEYQDNHEGKAHLAELLLDIARKTGSLDIVQKQGPNDSPIYVPYYEDVVMLTLSEDIVTDEQFFMPLADGGLAKLATITDSDEQGETVTAQPYAIENNPNAYELMLNGENYRGTPLYKAVTCDESQTEITVAQLAQILKNDPNTTVIYKADPDNLSRIVTAILKVEQITTDGSIRLTGTISQNHGFNCEASVMVAENQIRLSTTQKA